MLESPRVLVVDDEQDARDLISRGLTRSGYTVTTAADGTEATALLNGSFDVVVTDLVMPRLGGLGLLARVMDLNPRAIRVVVTSFADKEHVLSALNAGAHYLVEKPFTTHQLEEVLRYLLAERDRASSIDHLLGSRMGELRLTDQERKLVALVLKGLPNREIGTLTNVSEQVVKNQLFQLYRKLGISSRGELFHLVFPI